MRGGLADLVPAQPAAPVLLCQNKKTSMSAQSSATVKAAYPYQSIFTSHALADCRPAGVLDGPEIIPNRVVSPGQREQPPEELEFIR